MRSTIIQTIVGIVVASIQTVRVRVGERGSRKDSNEEYENCDFVVRHRDYSLFNEEEKLRSRLEEELELKDAQPRRAEKPRLAFQTIHKCSSVQQCKDSVGKSKTFNFEGQARTLTSLRWS